MTCKPVASEDLILLGIQSFVRGYHVYLTPQLRQTLTLDIRGNQELQCNIFRPEQILKLLAVATVY